MPRNYHLIKEITKYSITFQCHPYKFNNAVDHAATFILNRLFQVCSRAFQAMHWNNFSTLDHKSCKLD